MVQCGHVRCQQIAYWMLVGVVCSILVICLVLADLCWLEVGAKRASERHAQKGGNRPQAPLPHAPFHFWGSRYKVWVHMVRD